MPWYAKHYGNTIALILMLMIMRVALAQMHVDSGTTANIQDNGEAGHSTHPSEAANCKVRLNSYTGESKYVSFIPFIT